MPLKNREILPPVTQGTVSTSDIASAVEMVSRARRADKLPDFNIGDTVDVHLRVGNGRKARVQVFSGVVVARSGKGAREMFTVRRNVAGKGVERKFPVNSPSIDSIKVKRSGVARRAKLYFLRDRVGKAVRLRETRR